MVIPVLYLVLLVLSDKQTRGTDIINNNNYESILGLPNSRESCSGLGQPLSYNYKFNIITSYR